MHRSLYPLHDHPSASHISMLPSSAEALICPMEHTDLRYAFLTKANLAGAHLDRAKLAGAQGLQAPGAPRARRTNAFSVVRQHIPRGSPKLLTFRRRCGSVFTRAI